MDDTRADNSIKNRLRMQNEVLMWLEEFSEKLQMRANSATMEVHALMDQASVVEQDLKNTFNSFRNLSYLRFVENKISDKDEVGFHMKEDAKNSAAVGIPAQSYEADILPRYKEALSLGVSSYRHHLQKIKRISSRSCVFKIGSAHGALPHIIGSEEYIHDNSCGLTEDFPLDNVPLDFSHVAEPTGVPSVAGESVSHPSFSSDLFGIEHGPSEKDGVEPLVSAAFDFKAMLEAALLSPYKFYDEESSSLRDSVNGCNNNAEQKHPKLDHVTSTGMNTIADTRSQHLSGTKDTNVPITAVDCSLPPDPEIHKHKYSSMLISGSLFDVEEESPPSNQNLFVNIPISVVDSCNLEFVGAISDNSADSLVGIYEEETTQEAPLDTGDTFEKGIASNSVGGLIGEVEQHSSTSSSSSGSSSSMIPSAEISSLPDERLLHFKLATSIIEDMPRIEEPTFSMLVSVSQESPATLSSSHDLYPPLSYNKENCNCSSSIEENTVSKENCNIAEMPQNPSQTSLEWRAQFEEEDPSGMRFEDGSVAVDSIRECALVRDRGSGEASQDIEKSLEAQECSSHKRVNFQDGLSESEEVQYIATPQMQYRGDQEVSSSSGKRNLSTEDKNDCSKEEVTSSSGKRNSSTEDKNDDSKEEVSSCSGKRNSSTEDKNDDSKEEVTSSSGKRNSSTEDKNDYAKEEVSSSSGKRNSSTEDKNDDSKEEVSSNSGKIYSFTEDRNDSSKEGKGSVIASLLKLPSRRPSLFDSDEE